MYLFLSHWGDSLEQKDQKILNKSELWAGRDKLLFYCFFKFCVFPQCWVMSSEKSDIPNELAIKVCVDNFLSYICCYHVTAGILKINKDIFVGGRALERYRLTLGQLLIGMNLVLFCLEIITLFFFSKIPHFYVL